MLSRKRAISLTVPILLVFACVMIAVRYSRGETNGPTKGMKVKVLRRKDQLHMKPTGAEIASPKNRIQEGSTSPSKEERELEDKIPAHLPIRIKIRKEKEKAFKDLKNERWARDFEVEITNTGNKPIYFLYLLAVMPEIRDANGYNIAFAIFYGRTELGDIRTKANADDVSLKPGETYVFKNSEGVALSQALGFEAFQRKQNWSQPKKLQLKFEVLSFGDGTGYAGEDGVALPHAPNEQTRTGSNSKNQASQMEPDPIRRD